MVGDWRVGRLPRCSHHVFLSHCAEDRNRLAQPIYEALEESKYFPWLDRHDYPRGRDPFAALREGILGCRHVVSIISSAFLSQGRGWTSVENTYAGLLQENFKFQSLELCTVQFPLFILPHDHEMLRRSSWAPLIHRGRFYPPGIVDHGAVGWAVREIIAFIKQEEKRGAAIAEQVEYDRPFRTVYGDERHVLRRIMCADPPPSAE